MRRVIGIYLLLIVSFTVVWAMTYEHTKLIWRVINVNSTAQQGDANLISKNGHHILVDTGAASYAMSLLIPYLKKNRITRIDDIYISHPHSDHYGGTKILIESGFEIGKIHMNMPPKEQMKLEYWSGDYDDLLDIQKSAKAYGIPVVPIKAGERIAFDSESYIEVLYSYDGLHTPIGKTDINDMSAVMMIHDGINRFLLTGDLNYGLGKYLANNAQDIQADIIKAPHHGAESLAPNSFFEKVNPKVMIVPAPKDLWCSNRSDRTRELSLQNNYTTYVNGFHGHITIISDGISYFIETQYKPESICKKEVH